MKRKELEHKYGKKLINKIFTGDYLNGCTIAIVDGERFGNDSHDIYDWERKQRT